MEPLLVMKLAGYRHLQQMTVWVVAGMFGADLPEESLHEEVQVPLAVVQVVVVWLLQTKVQVAA